MPEDLRLANLDPHFLKIVKDSQPGVRYQEDVAIDIADGIRFLCPKCFEENGRQSSGVHSIICLRPHVDKDMLPGPGRWSIQGTCYEDVSLVAGSSSVHLQQGCRAHFFIERGKVRIV